MECANNLLLFHVVPTSPHIRPHESHIHGPHPYVSQAGPGGSLGIEVGFHRERQHQKTKSSNSQLLLELITALWLDDDLVADPGVHLPHIALEFLFDAAQSLIIIQLHDPSPATGNRGSAFTVTLPGLHPWILPFSGTYSCQYGVDLAIAVAGCSFQLTWGSLLPSEAGRDPADVFRSRALRGCDQRAIRKGPCISRLLHHSKLPKSAYVDDVRVSIDDRTATGIAAGSNGTKVLRAVDKCSATMVAVKVFKLRRVSNDPVFHELHQEIGAYIRLDRHGDQRDSQGNIAEYLGYDRADTDEPRIFMRLYEGNLNSLKEAQVIPPYNLHLVMLQQMLAALQYLELKSLCHRDVKPQNILWTHLGDHQYRFFLADFGQSRINLSGDTQVGTDIFMAPEVGSSLKNHHKMDIWSLLVTFITVFPDYDFPAWFPNPRAVQEAITSFARKHASYDRMAQVDPKDRASAECMLKLRFEGEGITRRRSPRIATLREP